MDTWHKYKNIEFKNDLKQCSIEYEICYGNYLVHKIALKASQNKLPQRLINSFFKQAIKILQITIKTQNIKTTSLIEVYDYIDTITRDLRNSSTSLKELGLMIGNLSEIESAHYTFVELIAFVRILAEKI